MCQACVSTKGSLQTLRRSYTLGASEMQTIFTIGTQHRHDDDCIAVLKKEPDAVEIQAALCQTAALLKEGIR